MTLKQSVSGQASELKSYKERVQKLQNELIKVREKGTMPLNAALSPFIRNIVLKSSFFCLVAINSQKNDSEKKLILMNRAHKSQNEVLQRLQEKADKIRRYEEAMRKQEKVIEKLEKVANKAPISESLIQSASE